MYSQIIKGLEEHLSIKELTKIKNEWRSIHFKVFSKVEKIVYYTNDIIFDTGALVVYAMYANDEILCRL